MMRRDRPEIYRIRELFKRVMVITPDEPFGFRTSKPIKKIPLTPL
jgi:hypothetical protein